MQLFILALLVTTYVAGTFCQKITFDNIDAGGITEGRFYIDGTIGESVTKLLQQNWLPIIFIEVMKVNASSFSTMCQFDVSGATCDPYPPETCQCVYNKTTDNVYFVVNGTASPDLYKAIIRAQWQHQNLTNVYSNKNYTVVGPKDVPSTTVETTNDGNTAINAVEDTTSVSITSPATVHATDETTTATESPSSSPKMTVPPTTPPPPRPRDIILIVCLCVIIPILVITIVIGAVWRFKKLKKSKAVSNNGTDSKAKADTNEPSESDRHYSEHPNNAYENERRTSPSNVTVDEVKTTPNDNLQQHNSEKKDVNKSHAKDKTNDGSASQTMPGEPRRLPPLKGTNIHGQLQPTGQPRPPSVEMTSLSVKHNS